MRKTVLIIMTALTALMLCACGGGRVVYESPEKGAVSGQSRTVLVYMCGGSAETQNGSFSKKLEGMMSTAYPDNLNVVVETGGSSLWHEKGVYSDYLQRFEVGENTLFLADQSLSANMGEHKTLSDFITWGMTKYKADSYVLIIAGSGGGSMNGMCSDELFDGDCLSLEETAYAMSSSGKSFDFVLADAPLMGSLEMASLISTYTDYLAAPQDIMNPDDVNYADIMGFLAANPLADGLDIGKAVCDSYYRRATENGDEKFAAMSVIDMSGISTLNQAFDGMVGDMITATDSLENYRDFSFSLMKAHSYGGLTADEGMSNLIDLGDAAVKCGGYTGQTSDMLIEALNNTVAYRVCGEYQSGSTGMSFYYPLDMNNETLQEYMDMSLSSKYREFLRKICVSCSVTDAVTNTPDYTSSWAWTTYNDDMAWLEYKSILDANTYELDISGNMDLFRFVDINMYKEDEKSGEYAFIGKYMGLDSDWEAGIFKDNFNGTLPRLINKNAGIRRAHFYDDYEIYAVPVVLDGRKSSIRIKYEYATDSYEILGVWDGLDEKGQVCGSIRNIKFFDRIMPLLPIYDEEHQRDEYITGSPSLKLWNGVDYKKLDNGNYILEYEITDIYGQKRWGTPVKAVAEGGRLTFQ